MRWPRILLLTVAVGLVGCGDDAPPSSSPDAGSLAMDAASNADAAAPTPDAGGTDSGAADLGSVDLAPAEPLAALEPWSPPGPFFVTTLTPGGPDPLARPFLERRFPFPDGAGTTDGLRWVEQVTDDAGEFFIFGQRTIYAALRLEVTEPLRLAVRLNGFELLIDDRTHHQPDPYRTGRVRHPIALAPGTHELVFRGDNTRGPPSLRFERVSGPVQPNRQDITRPDLIPGERTSAPLGVHVLNTSGQALSEVDAVVIGDALFETTARRQADMPRDVLTSVAFDLIARGPIPEGVDTATLTLGLQARQTGVLSTFELALPVRAAGTDVRRTFISAIDDSVQYYAVNGPTEAPVEPAALVLSLHGAGVQAAGQARAYGTKDWAYVVAATNRRPFGFDWQDWGRLDALEVLEHAQANLPIDPAQVYLTGHSMGGHGTWHVGMMHPDRFAVLGPSAGWISFSTYGGTNSLPATWEPGRLHDDTLRYKTNLAERGVYIIHGDADDNVPVTQGRTMLRELTGVTPDLFMHEEPGAGHWWDGDPSPGARCVDFPPLFDLMRQKRLDLADLDFAFTSPAPWVSPSYGYLSVHAVEDPYLPFSVTSRREGARVSVVSDNARSVVVDGAALERAGIEEVVVDGVTRAVAAEPMRFGSAVKRPGRHGPVKEVFFRRFCFVHDDGDVAWAARAASLTSSWAVIGNGSACTLPFSRRAEAGDRNRIYLGIASDRLDLPEGMAIGWSGAGVDIDGSDTGRPTFAAVTFPEGEHLAVALAATAGAEWMATYFSPFSSRAAFPDWFTFVLNDDGNPAYGPAGWFDANWAYDASLSR